MPEKVQMEIGQKFPLTIKRLGINGEGVGFYKRNVVFVKGALPGEEVTVKVSKLQRNFAEAEILNIRKIHLIVKIQFVQSTLNVVVVSYNT